MDGNTKTSSPDQRLTIFISIPVRLARRMLDSVDNGLFADPTEAMLHALYRGDFLGEGPDPTVELEAALASIEQRLAASDRLIAVRAKLAEPTPSQPKPAPKPEPAPEPVPAKPAPPVPAKPAPMREKWAQMTDSQKVIYIKSIVAKPMGKKGLRYWLGDAAGLQIFKIEREAKAIIDELRSVLGADPRSSRDPRVQDIKAILDDENISLRKGLK